MQRPFILIDGKLTEREEFTVRSGHQPTNSLFYLKEGEFSLLLNGKKSLIKAGDTVIFDDSQEFIRSVKSKIVFVYIKFKVNENCKFICPLPTGKIEFKDKLRFISTITEYEKSLADDSPLSIYYRQHLLEDILLQAGLEYSGLEKIEKGLPVDDLVRLASEYIDNNINKKFNVQELSKACATNPSTLNFRFRRVLNQSVWEFVVSKRVERAKKLLLTTTYKIGDVAERCGFENAYYFSTAFKKQEGLSPKEFRSKQGVL